MEGLNLTLVIVFIIVWLTALLWMANDVWETHGAGGCFVLLVLYFFLAPLFPLLVLGYLFMKYRLWHGGPSAPTPAERVSQYDWRSRLGSETDQQPLHPAADVNLSASDSDEEIDLLLAEGKVEEALALVREKFDTAKSFGDTRGMERYRKYAGYIRARGGGRK